MRSSASHFLPKLLAQLVPAALVTTVGVLLLGNLTKAPSVAPDTRPAATAINAEAVFKITPREIAAAEQSTKPKAKPKSAGAAPISRPAAEPPRQIASVPLPEPLPITPPQPAAEAPRDEGMMMRTWRSTTSAVTRIPQWAASSMAGWLPEGAPPRPPAPIPMADFQAAM